MASGARLRVRLHSGNGLDALLLKGLIEPLLVDQVIVVSAVEEDPTGSLFIHAGPGPVNALIDLVQVHIRGQHPNGPFDNFGQDEEAVLVAPLPRVSHLGLPGLHPILTVEFLVTRAKESPVNSVAHG